MSFGSDLMGWLSDPFGIKARQSTGARDPQVLNSWRFSDGTTGHDAAAVRNRVMNADPNNAATYASTVAGLRAPADTSQPEATPAGPGTVTGATPISMVPSIQSPNGQTINNPFYANGGLRTDAASYAQTLGLPAGSSLPYWTNQGIPWNVNTKSFVDPSTFATQSIGGVDSDYLANLRADFEKSRREDVRSGGLGLLDKYTNGGIWSPEDQASLLDITGRLSPEAAANLQDQFGQARNVPGSLPDGVTWLNPMSAEDWQTALGEDLYKQYAPALPVIPSEFDTTPTAGTSGSFLDQLHAALGDSAYNSLIGGNVGSTNPQSSQMSSDLIAAILGMAGAGTQDDQTYRTTPANQQPAMTSIRYA